MILHRYLVVGKKRHSKPTVSVKVSPPALQAHEIAIRVNLNIPDQLFEKPQLEASITVPEGAIAAPVIDAEMVDNIEEVVSQTLGVSLSISVVETDNAS